MLTRPEPERGAVGIAIRRIPRLRVVLDLCLRARLMFLWPQTRNTAIARTTSAKRLLKKDRVLILIIMRFSNLEKIT